MDMTDRFAIEDLLQRYTTAVDNRDWELLDTVFTANASLDYLATGGIRGAYPEVRQWLAESLALFPISQHMLGKTEYQPTEDGVACRTIVHNPMGVPVNADGDYDPEGSSLRWFFVGGWYNDLCVSTPDGWRIAEKVMDVAHFTGTIPPGFRG